MNEWMDEWNCVSCLLLKVCVIFSVYLCRVLLCVCECVSVCLCVSPCSAHFFCLCYLYECFLCVGLPCLYVETHSCMFLEIIEEAYEYLYMCACVSLCLWLPWYIYECLFLCVCVCPGLWVCVMVCVCICSSISGFLGLCECVCVAVFVFE